MAPQTVFVFVVALSLLNGLMSPLLGPVFGRELRTGELVKGPRTGRLEPHELGESHAATSFEDVLDRHPEAGELVSRQVDAVTARILADVADDVGELEGDAEGLGVFERRGIGEAENAG